jgi:hypothetical protein
MSGAVLAGDAYAGRARLGDALHRLDDRLDGGAPDLVAIQAALAGRSRGERAARPTGAGVEWPPSASRTVTPHSPAQSSIAQSNEEGPAVAGRAGVHDQAAVRRPDGLGDELLEHRAHDELGPVRRDGRLHRRARVDHLTSTSCPSSVSAIHARWLRLLWAEARKRMRMPRRRGRNGPLDPVRPGTRLRRQGHPERAASAWRRLDPDASAMQLDDLAADREPEAGARGLAVDLPAGEELEDAIAVALAHARTVVGHGQASTRAGCAPR